MKKEIIVELTNKFPYSHKGMPVEAAEFIALFPPTSKHMDHIAYLKQCFYRSIPTDTNGSEEIGSKKDEDKEIDGSSLLQLMMMSDKVEIKNVFLTAKELFCSGIAMVDGQEKLTKTLLDLVDLDDFEKMVGDYLANFILASALQKMKKSS